MDPYYATKMAAKTDAALFEYFHNHGKYVPEAVLAAVAELQNRGCVFSAAELATLEPERQAVRQAAAITAAVPDEEDIIPATAAPRFYSPGAIFGFSFFFSSIFGAVLLATNIRQTGNRKGGWVVVGFSLLFMLLEGVLFWQLKQSSNWPILAFNVMGAFILNYYFWPKYLGLQLTYEAKPIWRALLISILIMLSLLAVLGLLSPQR